MLGALSAAVAIGLGGIAWFTVIAVMTQIGFSGNNRYLVLGAALVDVCGGVGFGCLAIGVAALLTLRRHQGSGATLRRAALAGTAAAAVVFALLPAWIQGSDFVALPKLHRALLYQARLRTDLGRAIALVGGRDRLLACGSVMVEGFQVPMVAYALDVPTTRVLAPPALATDPGPEPDTILQTRATQSSGLLPESRTGMPRTTPIAAAPAHGIRSPVTARVDHDLRGGRLMATGIAPGVIAPAPHEASREERLLERVDRARVRAAAVPMWLWVAVG